MTRNTVWEYARAVSPYARRSHEPFNLIERFTGATTNDARRGDVEANRRYRFLFAEHLAVFRLFGRAGTPSA